MTACVYTEHVYGCRCGFCVGASPSATPSSCIISSACLALTLILMEGPLYCGEGPCGETWMRTHSCHSISMTLSVHTDHLVNQNSSRGSRKYQRIACKKADLLSKTLPTKKLKDSYRCSKTKPMEKIRSIGCVIKSGISGSRAWPFCEKESPSEWWKRESERERDLQCYCTAKLSVKWGGDFRLPF